ncbi:MAG: YcxB family protein [Bacteroidota bacterium]
MIIRTKKYKLATSRYIKTCYWEIMRSKWWVLSLFTIVIGTLFYTNHAYWATFVIVLLLLFLAFYFFQLYAVTVMPNNKLFFERLSYQISSKQIMVQITSKQGMPIMWDQIKFVRKKKSCFILFLSTAQFLYWPYRIFNTLQEIKFLKMLLKRKKLLK